MVGAPLDRHKHTTAPQLVILHHPLLASLGVLLHLLPVRVPHSQFVVLIGLTDRRHHDDVAVGVPRQPVLQLVCPKTWPGPRHR